MTNIKLIILKEMKEMKEIINVSIKRMINQPLYMLMVLKNSKPVIIKIEYFV